MTDATTAKSSRSGVGSTWPGRRGHPVETTTLGSDHGGSTTVIVEVDAPSETAVVAWRVSALGVDETLPARQRPSPDPDELTFVNRRKWGLLPTATPSEGSRSPAP